MVVVKYITYKGVNYGTLDGAEPTASGVSGCQDVLDALPEGTQSPSSPKFCADRWLDR